MDEIHENKMHTKYSGLKFYSIQFVLEKLKGIVGQARIRNLNAEITKIQIEHNFRSTLYRAPTKVK